MKSVLVIAQNTFKEMIRDRVLYSLIFFCFFILAFSYLLGFLSFAEQERIITNMGLMSSQLGCCALAVFLGSSLVWREIEKQTILVLLSKPLSRIQFLLGKYFGLSFVLMLMNLFLSFVLFLICFKFSFFNFKNFIYAQIGVWFESQILLSIAMFFGVFCKPVLTVFYTVSLWIIGHFMNDFYFFSQKSDSVVYKQFGYYFSKYGLNFQRMNFREAVIYQDPVSLMAILNALIYSLAWLLILMFLAHRIFKRRDFI